MFSHSAIREAIHNVHADPVSVTTISPIEPGKNHSYRITLQNGSTLFLKVGTRFPDAFPAEPKTMELLRRDTDLPIPRVHATGKAPLGYPFAVHEFINDTTDDWIRDLSLTTAKQLCREAGNYLRELHQITFPQCGRIGIEGDRLTVVEPLAYREMLQHSLERQLTELHETPFAERCQPLREFGYRLLDRIDFACIRPALVHGDYRLENLSIDPTSDQVTVAILDWELPTAADPLWDAAMAQALLTDGYGIDPKTRESLRTVFWREYGESPDESARWQYYELLARIRLARHLTTEMHEETDTAVVARIREHNDAFDDFLDGIITSQNQQDETEG